MTVSAAIVGSGNIGTDLMYKLLRSELIEPRWMIGVDPESEGLRLAADAGPRGIARRCRLAARAERTARSGVRGDVRVRHVRNAPRYAEAGIRAIDLTPAARGPYVIPPVNLHEHAEAMNVNMVTCGGQATIPMVHAVSRVVPVDYAEIVATVASKSAGPGTRRTSTSSPAPRPTRSRCSAAPSAARRSSSSTRPSRRSSCATRSTAPCRPTPRGRPMRSPRRCTRSWPRCSRMFPATGSPPTRSSTWGSTPMVADGSRSSSRSRGRATICRPTRATSTS